MHAGDLAQKELTHFPFPWPSTYASTVTYGPENVSVQSGGKPVIWKFLSVVMEEGDEVLYPSPGYPIYESMIRYFGGTPVPYSYRYDHFISTL